MSHYFLFIQQERELDFRNGILCTQIVDLFVDCKVSILLCHENRSLLFGEVTHPWPEESFPPLPSGEAWPQTPRRWFHSLLLQMQLKLWKEREVFAWWSQENHVICKQQWQDSQSRTHRKVSNDLPVRPPFSSPVIPTSLLPTYNLITVCACCATRILLFTSSKVNLPVWVFCLIDRMLCFILCPLNDKNGLETITFAAPSQSCHYLLMHQGPVPRSFQVKVNMLYWFIPKIFIKISFHMLVKISQSCETMAHFLSRLNVFLFGCHLGNWRRTSPPPSCPMRFFFFLDKMEYWVITSMQNSFCSFIF